MRDVPRRYHSSEKAEQVMAQKINFMKNCSIVGGMLLLFAFGPGRYSVDRA